MNVSDKIPTSQCGRDKEKKGRIYSKKHGKDKRANEKIQVEKNGTDKGKVRRYRRETLEAIENL